MMNKSKIDWCTFTWNPVTGCRHQCSYCYAARQAHRFSGDIRLNKANSQMKLCGNGLYILEEPFVNKVKGRVIPCPVGFEPTLHRYRLPMPAQKKKPENIFVCSMADLFGEWVPDEWIKEVFKACAAASWHNYLFLTKNPERYKLLNEQAILPAESNYWYGTTITKQSELGRISYLPSGMNRFVSIEPIQEEIDIDTHPQVDWIIVGVETGVRRDKVMPKYKWVNALVLRAKTNKIPILIKHSKEMVEIWGEELIQEFPAALIRAEKIIPHCSKCEYCKTEKEGNRGARHECEIGWEAVGYDDRGARHVTGRYARTSPPWCPRRKETEDV